MTRDDLHNFLTDSRGYEDKTNELLTKRNHRVILMIGKIKNHIIYSLEE